MRRVLVVVTLALLAVSPALASAGSLDLRIGGFFPQTDSNLFTDDSDLYTRQPTLLGASGRPPGLSRSDWNGLYGGIEYSAQLARNVELGFHVDGYGRSLDTSYRDHTRQDGSEIQQTLRLNVVPLGVSVRLVPGGRHAALAPYVAVGVDAVFYKYEEFGDFIDFFDSSLPIRSDSFRSEGVAAGVHGAAGLRVALGDDFALVAEGRYLYSKTDAGGDFRNYRIDLSGASATLGLHIRF
jgi:opacity protein-like surface antigen